MTPELQPSFIVTVTLDGDDYPPTVLDNTRAALDAALEGMRRDGLIVGYTLNPAGAGTGA